MPNGIQPTLIEREREHVKDPWYTRACIRSHFNFRFEKQLRWNHGYGYIHTMAEIEAIPIEKYHTSLQLKF